jgi:hypothetical protein
VGLQAGLRLEEPKRDGVGRGPAPPHFPAFFAANTVRSSERRVSFPATVCYLSEHMWGQRKRDRLRPLDEATAYARCHGERDENVKLVKLPPRRVRYEQVLSSGEVIRRDFEDKLDTREPETAV